MTSSRKHRAPGARFDAAALSDLPLPAWSASRQACLRLLQSTNCTLGRVVEVIMNDPGITVAVLHAVNGRRAAHRVRLCSVESAANLLGQTALRSLIDRLPETETLCAPAQLPLAAALLQRQRHAGDQAEHWAQLREDKSPSECRVAALCAGVPEIMLCVHQPELYRAVLQRASGVGTQAAARHCLGEDFAALGRRLAQAWRLPELLDDVWQPARYEFYRPQGVMLAQELARCAEAGWYSTRSVLCLEVIADYLGWSFERCCAMVHQVALRSARTAPVAGAVAAAARLVQLPPAAPRAAATGLRPDPAPHAAASLPAEAAPDGQARLHAVLLQARQRMRGAEPAAVLSTVLQTAHRELRFARAVLYLRAREGSTLKPRAALGENSTALGRIEIDLAGGGVFAGLLRKPLALLVNADNAERYAAHLPAALSAASGSAFACMSLFARGRPLGVLLVDQGAQGEVEPGDYAAFKKLVGLANQEMLNAGSAPSGAAPAQRTGTG